MKLGKAKWNLETKADSAELDSSFRLYHQIEKKTRSKLNIHDRKLQTAMHNHVPRRILWVTRAQEGSLDPVHEWKAPVTF